MSQPACFGAKSAQKTIIEAKNGPLTDAAMLRQKSSSHSVSVM
jgi:hypothetical protein